MYSSSLRAARVSRGTVLRSALLGRIGGGGGAAAVAAPAGCVVAASRGRSASSLTSAAASAAGGMEQPKQQPQQQDVVSGEKNDTHRGHHWDPIAHSFGEGYATRADEEGFGGVYARGDDDDDKDRHGHRHPAEYDTSQGSHVKEKEKGRHCKDDKHAA